MTKAFDLSKARVNKVEPLSTEDAKWADLQKVYYTDPAGQDREWEYACHKTRISGNEADAVSIIAILEKPTGPEILLEKQFRPPIGGVCIEIPAGLIDPSETIFQCAERELYEETGYIGVAQHKSNHMYGSPGFTNHCSIIVTVSIDLLDPRNQNPKPNLEDGEFIETFSVPLKDLKQEVDKLAQEGYKIESKLQTIVASFEIAKQYSVK